MISLSSALPLLVRSLVQFTVAVYVLGAQPVAAAEELLVHVLSAGAPVSGASVVIDGVTRGRTLQDGSLLVDINAAAVLSFCSESGRMRRLGRCRSSC